jgi:hypothetical protein
MFQWGVCDCGQDYDQLYPAQMGGVIYWFSLDCWYRMYMG